MELGMLNSSRFITVPMLAVATWLSNGKPLAAIEVDLALVLAVDVSFSMESDEQDLQRQGFVEAFRSPEVHQSVRQGMLGRIAVIYMEWSGAFDQQIMCRGRWLSSRLMAWLLPSGFRKARFIG
jgi:hypothetical protein